MAKFGVWYDVEVGILWRQVYVVSCGSGVVFNGGEFLFALCFVFCRNRETYFEVTWWVCLEAGRRGCRRSKE